MTNVESGASAVAGQREGRSPAMLMTSMSLSHLLRILETTPGEAPPLGPGHWLLAAAGLTAAAHAWRTGRWRAGLAVVGALHLVLYLAWGLADPPRQTVPWILLLALHGCTLLPMARTLRRREIAS